MLPRSKSDTRGDGMKVFKKSGGIDTSTATATAADITAGKTAFVSTGIVIGTSSPIGPLAKATVIESTTIALI